jgi:hypothetical protein
MTIEEMITNFRRTTRDFIEQGSTIVIAREDQRRFHLARRFIVAGSFSAFQKDASDAWVPCSPLPALDCDAGWIAFTADYDIETGDEFRWDLAYTKRFNDEMAIAWMNAGVNELWPEFYIYDTAEIAISSSVHEYAWPEGAYNVTDVETRSSSVGKWVQNKSWDHAKAETTIKFYRNPGTGQARLTYMTKPVGAIELEDGTDEFTVVTGLPAETEHAIMLYLEYSLARSEELERASGHGTVNFAHSNVRIADLSQATKDLYASFVTYKRAVAMQPPMMSIRTPV